MKVGLLGGSFDPLHQGHIALAKAALKQFHLSKVIFVLSPRSPLKKYPSTTSDTLRLCMLRLGVKGLRRMSVGTWEMNWKGPSYTYRTLRVYKTHHPQDEIYFVIGSDNLKEFPRWKKPESIVQTATLMVGKRPGSKETKLSREFKKSVVYLKGRFPKVSSTLIRDRIRKRESLKGLVPRVVEKFIRDRGVYGLNSAELFTKLTKQLKKEHSPARFQHSLGVAQLAGQLAQKHGWNPWAARLAGLLHDWAKEWPPQKLIGYALKHKLKVPDLDFMLRVSPNLLHAYVSADFAKKKKWITDKDSLNAIASHTLGRPGMGLAEKILYVADLVALDRRFVGVKKIRQEAFQNLQKSFAAALSLKMENQLRKHKAIHPIVIKVWNQEVCGFVPQSQFLPSFPRKRE